MLTSSSAPEIVNFAGRFNDRQAIDKALKQAQADVQYAAASRAFDKGDMEECLEQFFRAIHSRYDIEKPVPRRFIRRKLGVINTLKEQNKKLKEQMREQQERLRQYAHEYLLMGNECITQAHDSRAALANYDKALSLDPNYVDAWIRKGITLFNNKEYFDAENCFNIAVTLYPANFKAVYNRGKLRLKTENTEGAIADLDKATSLKPEHAGAHELFGDALLKVGKEGEAALQWRIAEELRKKNSLFFPTSAPIHLLSSTHLHKKSSYTQYLHQTVPPHGLLASFSDVKRRWFLLALKKGKLFERSEFLPFSRRKHRVVGKRSLDSFFLVPFLSYQDERKGTDSPSISKNFLLVLLFVISQTLKIEANEKGLKIAAITVGVIIILMFLLPFCLPGKDSRHCKNRRQQDA